MFDSCSLSWMNDHGKAGSRQEFRRRHHKPIEKGVSFERVRTVLDQEQWDPNLPRPALSKKSYWKVAPQPPKTTYSQDPGPQSLKKCSKPPIAETIIIDLMRSNHSNLRLKEIDSRGKVEWHRRSIEEVTEMVKEQKSAIFVHYRRKNIQPSMERMLRGLGRLSLGGRAQSVWARFTPLKQVAASSSSSRAS